MATSKILKWTVKIFVSAVALYYSFKSADIALLLNKVSNISPFTLLLLFLALFCVCIVRTVRYTAILNLPASASNAYKCYQGLSVEMIGNTFLPLRAGDMARCYTMQKLFPETSLIRQVSAYFIEKILDLSSIFLIAFFLAVFLSPKNLQLFLLTSFVLGVLILTFLFLNRQSITKKLSLINLPEKLSFFTDTLQKNKISLPPLKNITQITFQTLVVRLIGALFLFIVIANLDIQLSYFQTVGLMSIITLATLVPATPGYIGTYEAAAVFTLNSLFGVDKTSALSFAVIAHAAHISIWFLICAPGILSIGFNGNRANT